MYYDLVIENAFLVLEDNIVKGHLAINGDTIASIFTDDSKCPLAKQTIDGEGLYVLPGIIDSHVHLGLVEEFGKDCLTESRAAAQGGVTSMISHLIYSNSYQNFISEKRRQIEENSLIDIGFHVGLMNSSQVKEMESYQQMGVNSFKLYMAYKGKEGERLNIQSADDALIWKALQYSVKLGALVLAHAENMDLIFDRYSTYAEQNNLAAWDYARVGLCEAASICQFGFYAKASGARAGIVHISSKEGCDEIRRINREGTKLMAEVCPQYLALNHEDDNIKNPFTAKITPPVRSRSDNEAVWSLWQDGLISMAGTDHCSNLIERKLGENIWATRPGFPGLSTFLPILLSEGVNKGKITLPQLVQVVCAGNAKAFGLYPRKGSLKSGTDADIVLVDMDLEKNVRATDLEGFSDFTPFEGRHLKGWPVLTISHGKIIMRHGEIINTGKNGRFLESGNNYEGSLHSNRS